MLTEAHLVQHVIDRLNVCANLAHFVSLLHEIYSTFETSTD